MVSNLQHQSILDMIPQEKPFRFVDTIIEVDEESICGEYTFKKDEYFYKGHFPEHPITPGVILIESMAQIGLLALGIFLTKASKKPDKVFLRSSDIEFKQPVLPGDKVIVKAKKIFFRLNMLKCQVSMHHETKGVVCKGTITGIYANS